MAPASLEGRHAPRVDQARAAGWNVSNLPCEGRYSSPLRGLSAWSRPSTCCCPAERDGRRGQAAGSEPKSSAQPSLRSTAQAQHAACRRAHPTAQDGAGAAHWLAQEGHSETCLARPVAVVILMIPAHGAVPAPVVIPPEVILQGAGARCTTRLDQGTSSCILPFRHNLWQFALQLCPTLVQGIQTRKGRMRSPCESQMRCQLAAG